MGVVLLARRLVVAVRDREPRKAELLEGIWLVVVAVLTWSLVRFGAGRLTPTLLAAVATALLISPVLYHLLLRRYLRPVPAIRYRDLGPGSERWIIGLGTSISLLLILRFIQVMLARLLG